MNVIVYTKLPDDTGSCPYCHAAMDYLQTHNIQFEERQLNLYERQELYDQFELEGASRTVPQILLYDTDGEVMRIGGFQELSISGIQSLSAPVTA
jgi:glutaredoxin